MVCLNVFILNMIKGITAVIFDMDGVIVNSEPIHEQAFHEVMRQIGWDGKHNLNFKDYIGKSDYELWKDFIKKYSPKESFEELIEMKRARVIERLKSDKPFFPGVVELIERLHTRFLLGLASGSEKKVIETVLVVGNLRRFFRAVVSSGDVYKGKPSPDIFLLTARLMGANPAETCVIEDSRPGIQAGLHAGMKVVAVTNTHSPDELKDAHYIVSDYRELGKLLLK